MALHPPVAVVMINSRGVSHPEYVKAAKASVLGQKQYGGQITLFEVDNTYRFYSIGECWNAAIKKADGYTYVTFIGDDDQIAPGFIRFMYQFLMDSLMDLPVVGATCFCKPCDANMVPIPKAYMEAAYTGFYRRDFLLENKYSELLTSGVDLEHIERSKKNGHHIALCPYYFGYYYTMHSGQVSGMKRGLPIGAPKKDEPTASQN